MYVQNGHRHYFASDWYRWAWGRPMNVVLILGGVAMALAVWIRLKTDASSRGAWSSFIRRVCVVAVVAAVPVVGIGLSRVGATVPASFVAAIHPVHGTDHARTAASNIADNISSPVSDDNIVQGYWYCWDSGLGSPHHLGYPIAGDHLCTYGELRRAGPGPWSLDLP